MLYILINVGLSTYFKNYKETLVFLPFRQNRLLVPFACLHPTVRRHVALPNLRHLEFLTRDLYVFTRELLLRVVIAIYILHTYYFV
jgi:hypothetical protein